MDIGDVFKYILIPILGGIIGWQQYLIKDISRELHTMVTRDEFEKKLEDTRDHAAEKLNDKLGPVVDQLERIENKIDDFVKIQLSKD